MKTNELAHAIAQETIDYRRDIHRHPEPSMEEFRTTDRICEELDKLGVSYKRMKPPALLQKLKAQRAKATKSL